ncbi:MAG: undecaprenyl-diphosphate phosphatase [Burkholderiales bacterium]|jgi:undecaprenyl-diphosphatase|nr:undecaprenyl-diphosphate phosphatase [Burkholderiales bacterium]
MDPALALKALIMGIVEGLTEFLPISSTGHLIIAGSLLGFNDEKGKVFELVIQTGAMLAVCWEFRARFLGVLRGLTVDTTAQGFVLNLIAAFMPAAILGLALGSVIKAQLFHAVPVAIALIVGGFVILWVERRERPVRIDDVDRMTWRDALKVGLAQATALIPGVSRSGATIIGGMLFGLSRRAATEFSFFLAVPTLIAAGAYDLFKNRALLSADDLGLFGIGTVTAFFSAFICIRWLMRYVATHDFRVFAWYRIVFGLFILASAYTGVINW